METNYDKHSVEVQLVKDVKRRLISSDTCTETHLLRRMYDGLSKAERKVMLNWLMEDAKRDTYSSLDMQLGPYCNSYGDSYSPHEAYVSLPFFDLENQDDRELFALIAAQYTRDRVNKDPELLGTFLDEILKVVKETEFTYNRVERISHRETNEWTETVRAMGAQVFPILKRVCEAKFRSDAAKKAAQTRKRKVEKK